MWDIFKHIALFFLLVTIPCGCSHQKVKGIEKSHIKCVDKT